MRTPPAPVRLLTDEQIREAHHRYMASPIGLRAVARDYGISHVQLAAGFVRLQLPAKGNRTTDPTVVEEILARRDESGEKWAAIADAVNLSLRQVQQVYTNAKQKEH
jgi:hypothetical protein